MQRALRSIEAVLLDAAAVAAAWGVLLLGENVAVGFLWRRQFSGAWEFSVARHTVVPLAYVGLAPAALAVVGGWWVVEKAAEEESRGRLKSLSWAIVAGVGLAAAAVALGVSSGRHFANPIVRGVFVMLVAALGAGLGAVLAPRLGAWGRRPFRLAAFGLVVTIAAWLADSYVLPRLYPAFHWAALACVLLGAAVVGLAFRRGGLPLWIERGVGLVVVATLGMSCAGSARAARALDRAANVRMALVEHAPLLGPAVTLIAQWRAPANEDSAAETDKESIPDQAAEVARSLDWSGHDLLLISVDALRADHVTAYGYARSTTPNLDELARGGTLFEHAYCPTPHTSYSLTSMLTGKYMRPLLALGLGSDSETWAQALRRYGWRTAAFYPPAVFFIDEDRFRSFEAERLGFEYAKVEFADPALRERQVGEYLDDAPAETPLFLWVHLFEPHEPYVMHPDHVFRGGPSADVDAYDSEIAEDDDGIGALVRLVRARRPGVAVIVTADHGEEFGEHGGRYHGTTVYEEQVRVPIIVSGPGVRAGARVDAAVETIDLFPTVLSALGMPRPARLRGRDLGPLLKSPATAGDGGFAFAETDDYALLASGDDRLVCERRAAACALYRPKDDPGEHRDRAQDDPDRARALRVRLRAVERDHGRYEAGGPAWPEALRRGMQGEADAALDAAALLDDADVRIRRKAAEVCFGLKAKDTIPAVRRALARDEDDEVRRWTALALVRMGEAIPPRADALLADPQRDWRRRAALALGGRGEGRACDEIASWWQDVVPASMTAGADGEPLRLGLDLPQAEELLDATSKAKCRAAVPSLLRALDDVRARPFVADALGAIGDVRARRPLRAFLSAEPYVTALPHEARALLALGACDWSAASAPAPIVKASLLAPGGVSPLRLLVLVSDADTRLEAAAGGVSLGDAPPGADLRVLPLPQPVAGRVELDLRTSHGGVVAAWVLAAERLD
jgi:arylsulfatase A-like enzyme/HEAT repeat protein